MATRLFRSKPPSLRAKRSNPSIGMRGDHGLLRCARNDVVVSTECTSAISQPDEPEVFQSHSPKKERAQGMPGACCTRGLVCKRCTKNAHEHTGTVGAIRHSPRNGLSEETRSQVQHL